MLKYRILIIPAMQDGPDNSTDVEVKLKRDLSLWEVLMIGLGPTLGTTIFMLVGPGIVIAGSGLVLVFTLNFIVTIFTAMAYAELSSAFPDTENGRFSAYAGYGTWSGGWCAGGSEPGGKPA